MVAAALISPPLAFQLDARDLPYCSDIVATFHAGNDLYATKPQLKAQTSQGPDQPGNERRIMVRVGVIGYKFKFTDLSFPASDKLAPGP